MAETAARIRGIIADVPGATDVQVHQGMRYPEIHVRVNRAKSSYMGLNAQRIIYDVITGVSSNVQLNPGYWIDPKTGNAYFMVAQYPEQALAKFDDFMDMPLVGEHVQLPASAAREGFGQPGSALALGQTPFPEVPSLPAVKDHFPKQPILLRDIADIIRKNGPETVDHYNLERTMDILVSVPGNDLGRMAKHIEQKLATFQLPTDVTLALKGESDVMRAALRGFAATIPLAMVLIYLAMVSLFRSWLDPFIMMFVVPLGFMGVVWMLLLTHTSLNVESLIGTLMGIGIDVANSVLIIEFANKRLRQGMTRMEAVVEAGRLRIRPILMTFL